MLNNDTIASFITGGTGAVSAIRVSGPESHGILKSVFFPVKGKPEDVLSPRMVHFGDISSRSGKIDQGLAVFFKAPSSYTGEDCFEIYYHGSVLISKLLMESIVGLGARVAAAGEFTRRAFLNGKLDLLQAEAVNEIYQTKTERALSLVYNNLKGKFSAEISDLRNKLVGVISGIEAFLDFPEDEIDSGDPVRISEDIHQVKGLINQLLAVHESSSHIKNGYRIALFGLVNSGKSSILNRLLEEDRAIITDIPGTTRDIIEGEMNIDGILYRIFDMAGIRQTEDVIERIGIRKALKNARSSDLILFITDASMADQRFNQKLEKKLSRYRHIHVRNKCDLLPEMKCSEDHSMSISAKTGEGFDALRRRIIQETAGEQKMDEALFHVTERHKSHLVRTLASLDLCLETIADGYTLDCVTVDLYEALNYLKEIIGEISTEDILDRIFSTFCIGK